jgi:hypothetical protein
MADLTSVILDHERRRCEATVAGDAEALGKLFDDRLRYVHSNALVDGKSDYLANIANPNVDYRKMDWSDLKVTPLGADFAMAAGKIDQLVHTPRQDFVMYNIAMSIWSRESGDRWTLLAYQTTPRPAP